MRRLLLLRHAKADRHSAGGDRERPLSRRGQEDARRLGRYLADHGPLPDFAVASNARRAKQTLDLVLGAFPAHVTRLIEKTIYLADADRLLEILRQTPDKFSTLLAVGHNPGFAELAAALAGDGDPDELLRLRSKYPTAGLAILDFGAESWASVEEGEARLDRFITPAALRGDAADDPD
ncbi:MAG: histidine phosphatase family protein [Methylocystis sp.]|nr:histidine phosphatase family protein [Methylocystis sp.]MBI3274681.1 histidine phosphatase family protein [Methylocystis sp.]